MCLRHAVWNPGHVLSQTFHHCNEGIIRNYDLLSSFVYRLLPGVIYKKVNGLVGGDLLVGGLAPWNLLKSGPEEYASWSIIKQQARQ